MWGQDEKIQWLILKKPFLYLVDNVYVCAQQKVEHGCQI